MKKFVFIVGSLRKNSFNRQLAEMAGRILDSKAEAEFLEYADVPFMNQDIEFPTPESVGRVREIIMSADALWIFTPEYNYQIPGLLKNLLDWLSRPLKPGVRRPTAVSDKPVIISGAAGKSAAAGARKQLEKLLEIMSMRVVGGSGVGISLDAEAFSSNILNLSDDDMDALRALAELLIEEAAK